MILMDYEFEKMSDNRYQVRLCGEFVCYSYINNEKVIDDYLKLKGFETREKFLESCWN